MIKRLRLRLSVLVAVSLFVIMAGIVFAINYLNLKDITDDAQASLAQIASGGRHGQNPGQHQGQPPDDMGTRPDRPMRDMTPGQPPNFGDVNAGLMNFYTVELDAAGEVLSWESDRAELYSDQQVRDLAAAVVESGENQGRLGSQFYRLEMRDIGAMLVVLDARRELESARNMIVNSSVIGLVAFLLLGAGGVLTIFAMTKPVQVAFDKQKQFVIDASHELKTPLSVISANAEALEGEIGQNQWLEYIQSEVTRTSGLVHSLLTMAKMDQSPYGVKRDSFDLSRAVLSVALPFESSVYEQGRTMELDVEKDLRYNGDEEMIKQLVVNLLSNAVKYSNPGGRIRLSLVAKGDKRVLTVFNTGEGIAKDELSMVFDRFYRVDKARSRQVEGNGLGLAIANSIVQSHKGKIVAESQEGEWARFTVTL